MHPFNLLNRIGRAALMAFVGSLALFAGELTNMLPGLSSLEAILMTGLIGGIGLLVEFLRDKWDLQHAGSEAYRTSKAFLLSISGISRLLRGVLMGVIALGATIMGDWTTLLPDFGGITQIILAGVIGLIGMGVEFLRDHFDLAVVTSAKK